jgi:hypothetical protein
MTHILCFSQIQAALRLEFLFFVKFIALSHQLYQSQNSFPINFHPNYSSGSDFIKNDDSDNKFHIISPTY